MFPRDVMIFYADFPHFHEVSVLTSLKFNGVRYARELI